MELDPLKLQGLRVSTGFQKSSLNTTATNKFYLKKIPTDNLYSEGLYTVNNASSKKFETFKYKNQKMRFLIKRKVLGRSSSVINPVTTQLCEIDNFLKNDEYSQKEYEDPIDADGKVRKRFILGTDDSYIRNFKKHASKQAKHRLLKGQSIDIKEEVQTTAQVIEKALQKMGDGSPKRLKHNESRIDECISPTETRVDQDSNIYSRAQTGITMMTTNTARTSKLASGVRFEQKGSKALSKRKIKALREKTKKFTDEDFVSFLESKNLNTDIIRKGMNDSFIERINIMLLEDKIEHSVHYKDFAARINEFREKAQERSIEKFNKALRDWSNQK